MFTMIDNERFDLGCTWFTNKAHFHLNGFSNKQNRRFWGFENPHLCEKKLLHSPKITVLAAVCSRGIFGHFIMRETITSVRYVTILEQFVAIQIALEDQQGIE
ncbi:DDE_3 domain-containing protein [Nephila pilipes]|uniref:DDE_3 domain-containing protein n=1 Tax=Nephila pilipes TaxID=299642 RepID=A0A8X6NCV0_NEPPI|nr:DDE_3 domain-containing protein [Nephila pilipes]